MNTKQLMVLAALFVLLIVLVMVFFLGVRDDKRSYDPVETVSDSQPLLIETFETKKIVLFFLSEQDALLHPEERELTFDNVVVHQAKLAIEELIKGSQQGRISPLPVETELREIFITAQGIAYVDFSKELHDNHPSGSTAEICTIFAIVNSLTYNFKTIKRVYILINGGEQETLQGHIDLKQSLLPRYDLISN
jgi:spore germination protein GerM